METTENPAWPTTLRSRLRDGRLQGTDGSLWLYRAIPMAPVVEAKSPEEALAAAAPLNAIYQELAAMTSYSMSRRSVAKGGYRQTHLLLVNVPTLFEPNRGHPLAEFLRQQFPETPTDRRVLLFGVRLKDKIGGSGGLKQAVDSVVETLVAGQTPLADFDEDTARISAAMDRAGLIPATHDDIRLANAWWNHGQYPDTPMLVHPNHLHFFTDTDSVSLAHSIGEDRCDDWPDLGVRGQHAVSFASVQDLDLPFVDPTDVDLASWISHLVRANALVVSVRGQVEPAPVTRDELRRQRKRFIDDINERTKSGKMERAEQQEMLDRLGQVEGFYAGGGAPATLAGASIVVGFNGQIGDIQQWMPHGTPAKLALMAYRQPGAMAETMLCSHLRANPNLLDLPTSTIAYSGAPSLNLVGDSEGAVVGFTENDRQVAYLSPSAASAGDASPICVIPGQTGSGKTQLMLWTGYQFAHAGRPVIIWDPKQESDHSAVALASGGQVFSLDELMAADGVFDPIRFSATKEVGVELAASMLMSINPWGSSRLDFEVPLQNALAYGVSRGATCIGQALAIARNEIPQQLPSGLVERVEQLAAASPQFRAIVGVNPQGQSLRAAQGITLIKVGSAYLDLPEAGAEPASIQQRIALALVRMVVFGSAMALAKRDGILMVDEAWIVLGAGRAEIERLGRLARSQQVLPMLYTQRVTDALNAGLAGYISRGLILPMEDPTEAAAACHLFKLEATPERMRRLTAKKTMGGNSAQGVAPNWDSMRALTVPVDPKFPEGKQKVLRGAIAIYADLAGRAIPCEVKLPPEFLAISSTSPNDIRVREAAAAARAAQVEQARRAAHTDTEPDAGGVILDRVF